MKKILVVEDRASVREFLTETLRDIGGFSVDTASNRPEAVEMAGKEDYDLCLVDIYLSANDLTPDGLEVIREVQKLKPQTKFIIMTGKGFSSLIEKSVFELGVTQFLSKPITVKDLLRKVSKVLRTVL